MDTIVLTDSPRVVDLKREFEKLCRREEALKARYNESEMMQEIRRRKEQINRLIMVATQ